MANHPFRFGAIAALMASALSSPIAAQTTLPLQPQRTVEFRTDEGTWISVDVSPDGKSLVFDLLGQLYTIPITGGKAAQITSGMGFNSQPRFSPDGKRLTFVSDSGGAENIWLSDADGKNARQVTRDRQAEFASPVWADGGRQILASRRSTVPSDSAFELWQYSVDGGSGIRITKAKTERTDTQINAIGAAVAADGRYIYYTRRSSDADFTPRFLDLIPKSQIVRRNRFTGEDVPLTEEIGSAFRPVLSPDGTQLAFGTRYKTDTALKIMDLRTRAERWLKYPVQRDDQESEYGAAFGRDILPGYAFTPDGKSIIITYDGKLHRIDIASGKESLIAFDANVSQGIGPSLATAFRVDQGPVKWRVLQGASISPDGRLSFSAGTHIFVQNDGRQPVRITRGETREYQPVWSPDGQWIAYVTWSAEGGQVWKIRGDGRDRTQLTNVAAYYRDLAWTPDGSAIVALRGPRQWQLDKPDEWSGGRGLLELVSVATRGGDTKTLAPAPDALHPQFVTSQPERVYLFSHDGLVSMRLDGTDKRTHLKITLNGKPGSFGTGVDAKISPDGNWIVARVSSRAYLLPFVARGGEPVTVDLDSETFAKTVVPVRKLSGAAVDSVGWATDGASVTWTVGAKFFRQPANLAWAGTGVPNETTINLEFPRALPRGIVLLRGARAITMRGDEVIENADILIRDNRISKIGIRGSFELPPLARIIDVSGSTIVPGFIDMHDHWFDIRRDVLDPDNNWDYKATLAYGVTTGRDPQTMTFDALAYQDLVDMGEAIGPRAYSTGPGVFAATNFQSFEEARDYLAAYKNAYHLNYLKEYLTGNRTQREWVAQAAKELGIMPTMEGHSDTGLALTHIFDGFSGLEHSMSITPLFKDVIQAMVQSGVTYTPTLVVSYGGPLSEDYFYEHTDVQNDPKLLHFVPGHLLDAMTRRRPAWSSDDNYVFKRLAAQDKKLVDAGGSVTVGSHGQLQGMSFHWEMWLLASGGMSRMQVLRAATMSGAEGLGLTQDLGSIEEGKLADLVILSRNPLDDIHNTNAIRYVMKDGRLYNGDTLDEIWPSARPLPKAWWIDETPLRQ